MSMSIIIFVSLLIWSAAIHELCKPTDKQNNRKIVVLTFVGTITTVILVIPLFQTFLA